LSISPVVGNFDFALSENHIQRIAFIRRYFSRFPDRRFVGSVEVQHFPSKKW
jgi:hypothetical protein